VPRMCLILQGFQIDSIASASIEWWIVPRLRPFIL
jgi:hypothetical protein